MNRRELLTTMANGFGMAALSRVLAASSPPSSPLEPKAPHFTPKAKQCHFSVFEWGTVPSRHL